VLIFRHGAWIHDYWQFYLIPFTALVCGWLFVAIARAVVPRAVALVAVIAVVFMLNLPTIMDLYSNYGRFAVKPLLDVWQ